MKILLFFLTCILLYGCGLGRLEIEKTSSTDVSSVSNRTWLWESTSDATERVVTKSPERYSLYLTDKGRAHIRFDCNRGGGQVDISPGRLSFGPLISTRMACSKGSLDIRFSRDLKRVVSFYTQGDSLYLGLTGGGMMIFHTAGTKVE